MGEAADARFAPGEAVRARAVDPDHHTRLPGYARGRTGRVVALTGSWPVADDVARRRAEPRVEPVYTVAFAARDLWGEGDHEVLLDLWQSYLEPSRAELSPKPDGPAPSDAKPDEQGPSDRGPSGPKPYEEAGS